MTKFVPYTLALCALFSLAASSFADSMNGKPYQVGNLYKMIRGTELCSTEGDCELYNNFLTKGDKEGLASLESSGHVTYLSQDSVVYLQLLVHNDNIAIVQVPGKGSAYTFAFNLFDR
jgi:hypothetical protein